jgi:hypothetical protein
MRNSRVVIIDSSCKSPDALPELWKTPYFSRQKSKKIRIGDVVTYVFLYIFACIFSV